MRRDPRTAMTEAAFQQVVIDYGTLLGWKIAHFRAARTKTGWVTPVAADGKGWPDLILVRGNRIIAAELKSAKGRATAEQTAWLDALKAAGIETHLWRPSDLDAIKETLR